MTQNNPEDLIKITDAARILGFKQRTKVDLLIKEGFIKTFKKIHSKQMWVSKEQIYNLPTPLPVPPPPVMIHNKKI